MHAHDWPLTDDDAWQDQAACRTHDPALWFPGDGDSKTAARAKLICQTCPVADQCLTDAIERRERYGIWGGMGWEQRRVETRRRLRLGLIDRKVHTARHGTESGYKAHLRRGEVACDACLLAQREANRARRKETA